MRTDRINKLSGGSRVTPERYNEVAEGLRYVQRFVANQSRESGAIPWRNFSIPSVFLASIQSAGPNGESDWTDARYWIRRAVPSPFDDTSAKSGTADYSDDGAAKNIVTSIDDPVFGTTSSIAPYWFTATNLAELPPSWSQTGSDAGQGCHLLSPKNGAIVEVRGYPDPSNPTKVWYAFSQPYPDQFVVSASDTRAGVYLVHPVLPSTSPFSRGGSSAVTLTDIGTASTKNCVFINEAEFGKSPTDPVQHNLIAGDVVRGRYWMDDESTPALPVFIGRTFGDENCSG